MKNYNLNGAGEREVYAKNNLDENRGVHHSNDGQFYEYLREMKSKKVNTLENSDYSAIFMTF